MSDAILPKSRTEADRESFTRDDNGKVARRVTDDVTHELLREIAGAVDDGEIVNQFDTVLAVASGAETLIGTYTVPAGKSFALIRVDLSGTNIATYNLYIDGDLKARKRTWFCGPFCEVIDFSNIDLDGLRLSEGQIIEIKVIHQRTDAGDFESRMQGLLETV